MTALGMVGGVHDGDVGDPEQVGANLEAGFGQHANRPRFAVREKEGNQGGDQVRVRICGQGSWYQFAVEVFGFVLEAAVEVFFLGKQRLGLHFLILAKVLSAHSRSLSQ